MKIKSTILTIGLASIGLVGCTTTTPTNNAVVVNKAVVNSNTAVVVNNNANMVMSNTNRWANANGVNRADYDKNRAEYEAEKGTSSIGQGANDSWIWFKTRAALTTTNDLRESTINVDVANDVITLKGTVATKEQMMKAEEVAKGIEGQKGVHNELKVAPADSMTNMNTNSMVNGNKSTNMKK